MDYIINPWWFYLISILSTVSGLSTIYFALSGLAFIYSSFFLIADDDNYETWKKAFKISIITLIPSIILLVFVPSEQTMNKMLIASVVTKQNIETGADFTQDQISKLIDKISDAAVKVKEANS